MKQKMIIRFIADKQKNQTKAMHIAAGIQGVETVALRGEEKNQLTVIGDCIDAVSITALLRKKLGFAQLISVTPYYDEDDDDGMDDGEDLRYTRTTIHPTTVYPQQPYSYQQPYYMIHDVGMNNHESCMIL